MSISGWVFDIQRFSLHDGPGIRTTVFLKGCPLRCPWCHNPEGLESHPQLRFTASLCIHCGGCAGVCQHRVHSISAQGHTLAWGDCERCGQCVEICPAGALEMVGRAMSAEEVLRVVRRDIPFYKQSGGGMTLSGGEPLAQYAFTKELLTSAKAEGLHTVIETSACAAWDRIEALLPLIDLLLVDIKHTDDHRHRALTGVSNRGILANIQKLADTGHPMTLRVPWVPSYNAEDGFLEGLCTFLEGLSNRPAVELMLYHRLGNGKWASLGGISPMPEALPAATPEAADPWLKFMHERGIRAKIGS